MQNRRAKQKLTLALDESGATAIFFALTLSFLCGFVALAFDIGHMVMVRAELQRTADAAALAGAVGLVPYTDFVHPTPNWLIGEQKSRAMISKEANKADNIKFEGTEEGVTVEYGYWYLKKSTSYVQELNTTRPTTLAEMPAPAIKVTLRRNVTLSFAPVIGVTNPIEVSATATAILPEGYSVAKGTVPLAVEKSSILYDSDHTINTEDLVGLVGRVTGQWFTLHGANDVATIRINEPMTALTQQVYITPGTEATVYQNMVDAGVIVVGQSMIVPVVNTIDKSVEKTYQDIIGFAVFLVSAVDKSKKTISGRYMENTMTPDANSGTGAGGTYYGVSGTPKLVSP
jgi:Flp pilus assembly protein TadG